MPRHSEEITENKREEIIDCCEKLYSAIPFSEITIKEIGEHISLSRPSIYNYFETREEIFLALLQREYSKWNHDLETILGKGKIKVNELCEELASSLEKRRVMLKLISTNLTEIETNSREERLVNFKREYCKAITLMTEILKKNSKMKNDDVLYTVFPFIFGIYPYAELTPKQIAAMEKVGSKYNQKSIKEIAYEGILRIIKS